MRKSVTPRAAKRTLVLRRDRQEEIASQKANAELATQEALSAVGAPCHRAHRRATRVTAHRMRKTPADGANSDHPPAGGMIRAARTRRRQRAGLPKAGLPKAELQRAELQRAGLQRAGLAPDRVALLPAGLSITAMVAGSTSRLIQGRDRGRMTRGRMITLDQATLTPAVHQINQLSN